MKTTAHMTTDHGGFNPLVAVQLRDPAIRFSMPPDDAAALWHSLGEAMQMEHSEGIRGDLAAMARAATRLRRERDDARGELAEEHEMRKAAEDKLREVSGALASEHEMRKSAEAAAEDAKRYQDVIRNQRDRAAAERDELREELATLARTLQETREQLDNAETTAEQRGSELLKTDRKIAAIAAAAGEFKRAMDEVAS